MDFVSNSRISLSLQERHFITEKLTAAKSERERLVHEHSEHHDALDAQISHYESSLAPVHNLPAELMEKIFLESLDCTTLVPFRSASSKESLMPSVLLLSMICGRWRDLVLSTPSLWSEFRIYVNEWYLRPDEELLQGVRLFLDRSKNHPLKFHFRCITDRDPEMGMARLPEAENAWRLLSPLLVAHSNRWSDVTLYWDIPHYASVFQPYEALAGNMRQLKRFTMFLQGERLPSTLRASFAHQDTPILENVKIHDGAPVDITFFASRTRTLHADGWDKISESGHPPGITEGSHLTMLTLKMEHSQGMGFLDSCSFPHLKSLEVIRYPTHTYGTPWRYGRDLWELSSLRNLFSRSSIGLLNLTVSQVPLHDADFIAFLELVPALQRLRIGESYLFIQNDAPPPPERRNFITTPNFLNRLNRKRGRNSNFLPQLEYLTLRGLAYNASKLDQKLLLGAVSSRMPRSATTASQKCLRNVSVQVCGTMAQFDVLSEMKQYEGDGLKIELRCSDDDDNVS